MRRALILSSLLLVSPVFSERKADVPSSPPPKEGQNSALNKIPIPFSPGSRFDRLRLPRYVGEVLNSYITLNYVEILSQDVCYGQTIYAEILRPQADTQIRAQQAWFDIKTGLMHSQGKVKVTDPRYEFIGNAMKADTSTGEYYITGPGKGFFNRKKALEIRKIESQKS